MRIIRNSVEYFSKVANLGDCVVYLKANSGCGIKELKVYKFNLDTDDHPTHEDRDGGGNIYFTLKEVAIV